MQKSSVVRLTPHHPLPRNIRRAFAPSCTESHPASPSLPDRHDHPPSDYHHRRRRSHGHPAPVCHPSESVSRVRPALRARPRTRRHHSPCRRRAGSAPYPGCGGLSSTPPLHRASASCVTQATATLPSFDRPSLARKNNIRSPGRLCALRVSFTYAAGRAEAL